MTKRLVDRASRPLEIAALLVRAAEAATRLGNAEEARTLLERASVEDPGDVVTWELLVRASDGYRRSREERQRRANLCARTSVVVERQLSAWYEAGQLWQDGDDKDDDRALAALRGRRPPSTSRTRTCSTAFRESTQRARCRLALASLLERRMECVDRPRRAPRHARCGVVACCSKPVTSWGPARRTPSPPSSRATDEAPSALQRSRRRSLPGPERLGGRRAVADPSGAPPADPRRAARRLHAARRSLLAPSPQPVEGRGRVQGGA